MKFTPEQKAWMANMTIEKMDQLFGPIVDGPPENFGREPADKTCSRDED